MENLHIIDHSANNDEFQSMLVNKGKQRENEITFLMEIPAGERNFQEMKKQIVPRVRI